MDGTDVLSKLRYNNHDVSKVPRTDVGGLWKLEARLAVSSRRCTSRKQVRCKEPRHNPSCPGANNIRVNVIVQFHNMYTEINEKMLNISMRQVFVKALLPTDIFNPYTQLSTSSNWTQWSITLMPSQKNTVVTYGTTRLTYVSKESLWNPEIGGSIDGFPLVF